MTKRRKRSKRLFSLAVICIALAIAALVFFTNQNPAAKTAKIYFFKNGKAGTVQRTIPEKADILYFVSEELLKGPTQAEKELGIFSRIPKNTKIRKIYARNGTVFADFSKELDVEGGGTDKVKGMLFQIVYTFTGLPGVKNIQILIDNKMQVSLGSEGYIIEKPLYRKDVSER